MVAQDKIIWNVRELSSALGIKINGSFFGAVQINSRDISIGDIFIALPGANVDGHNFVQDALERGAALAITSRNIDYTSDKIIVVEDCMVVLEKMAIYKRNNVKAQFIAITGSVGKTSLKEAAFVAFNASGASFCSRGNFNNKLGLFINLASIPDNAKYCILELGMNNAGELLELTKILKPNIAIINNIYNTHQANFATLKDIALAKAEILYGLDAKVGCAILPKDSDFYDLLKEVADNLNIKNIYDFSTSTQAFIELVEYTDNYITVKINDIMLQIMHNHLPKYQVSNFLPVVLAAYCLKVNLSSIVKGLQEYKICSGRGNIIECNISDKKICIIDDSYNSSPVPLAAAINSFDIIKLASCRKIAIIGDMLELGPNEVDEHSKFAELLAASSIDVIVTFGSLSKVISDKLKGIKEVYHYTNLSDLKRFLELMVKDGDYFLIKASYSLNLKHIVTFLRDLQ